MDAPKKIMILIVTTFFMIATCLNGYAAEGYTECIAETNDISFSGFPSSIIVSDSDPFYALIATPLAVHYNESGEQTVIPLYVKNFDNPSKTVERAEDQIGRTSNVLEINDSLSPKETSLYVAEEFWETSSYALLIKNDAAGYNLGIVAVPLASYLNSPVIVTDEVDSEVVDALNNLSVTDVYICGDLAIRSLNITKFDTVDEIIDECIDVINDRFGETVNYITMANPLDVSPPEVLDETFYEFNGTVKSGNALPAQFINLFLNKKLNQVNIHNFTIPEDYKYTLLKIDIVNLNSENVEGLGDRCTILVRNSEEKIYVYASTCAGLPARDVNGSLLEDRLHFETVIYNETGNFKLQVTGSWLASKQGSYNAKITLEKIDNPFVPLMPGLSSIAPYLTAYHKGIVFANTSFAFAADDNVIYNGSTCPGVSQPGTNPNLIVPSNNHTMGIHDKLNELIAQLAGIPVGNLEELRDHYAENPLYIAIAADPTMVPMYFYYNPDGRPDADAYLFGFCAPSDFIYADIDPDPADPENNTFSYWPFMENIVARVTGRDVQDCSALIARTIFYNDIIEGMGDWKNNALVQTGCGLEFQNLPIATRLSHLLYPGRGEPTKFPTGEITFINMRLRDDMATGEYNVTNTMLLQSQREGFSSEALQRVKDAGLMSRLLFPASFIEFLSGEDKVTGGQDQLNSSLIFSFSHGIYFLIESGDILIDSRGFPFVTWISRIYPAIWSGLSTKGAFDVRSLENMEYGPAVVFIESCITARTDGILGENTLSQTYIHSGANAYIGATRVTADPGYLEPRPLPGGWGIGLLGLIKATLDLKLRGKYPDLHFGAVIAEDFILELIENNATTGLALRNAKNVYLPKDANSTFLWTPPLKRPPGILTSDPAVSSLIQNTGIWGDDRTRTLDKKYVALHEFVLYGDPAFNPYQPINNG